MLLLLLLLFSNTLYLLTSISQRLVISSESGAMISELDQTLKKALVCVRRLFDAFIVRLFSIVSLPPTSSLIVCDRCLGRR